MTDIAKIINDIAHEMKADFSRRYGYTVFDINIKELKDNKGVIISGECLTHNQLVALKRRINDAKIEREIFFDVKALTDPQTSAQAKWWGRAKISLVNVTNDIGGKKLSTQLSPNDNYFKILIREKGRALILMDDHTCGWVNCEDIYIYKKDFSETWQNIKTPEKGNALVIHSFDPLFNEVFSMVNHVKYLHGGKSMDGIDCSALMQNIFKKALNITLPRHTIDQMKCGQRVSKDSVKTGDLVFAKLKSSNIMHVGLAFIEKEGFIIHACLREKLVIAEKTDDFFKYYDFAGARRIAAASYR